MLTFLKRLVLENGQADSEIETLEVYDLKLRNMNELQLCKETGTTHRDFVVHKLTGDDLRGLAMQNKVRELSGFYFEL